VLIKPILELSRSCFLMPSSDVDLSRAESTCTVTTDLHGVMVRKSASSMLPKLFRVKPEKKVALDRESIPNFDTHHELLPQHANCLWAFRITRTVHLAYHMQWWWQ